MQNLFKKIKDYNKEMQKCRAKQTKLGTELKKYQKQYDKLNEEIANTLIGESFYSPECIYRSDCPLCTELLPALAASAHGEYFMPRKALNRTKESTISLHGKHPCATRKALAV